MGYFKSYDIRGIYGPDLDEKHALRIGSALGRYFAGLPENKAKPKLRFVVGRDMRISAPSMSASLMDGLRSAGHDVIDIGIVTTPCCYFAIQRLDADGGIMCTASHNPPQYIGFKVSREIAIPISFDTGLDQVESMMSQPAPSGLKGSLSQTNLDEAYLDFVASMGHGLRPIKVAADASNGMVGKYLKPLFTRIPCQLEGIFLEPDGTFPNHEADPLKAENLRDIAALVRKTGAAIGFCFDGDGDRVAIVDEKGEIVGCDLINALIATDTLKEKPGRPVTYDLRSSKVVKDVVFEHGGEPVRSRVGHAHVKQMMRKIGAISGGELSGHYYFQLQDRHLFYSDSALVAVIRLLNLLSRTDQTISQLVAPLRKYFHTGEINFTIADKDAALAAIRETFKDGEQDDLDGITTQYASWWFNVRPSNTEPLLRLTLEGNTPRLRDDGLQRVLDILLKFGERASSSH